LCGKKVPSGVSRFKKHLAGGFPIVEKCPKATAEIRKEMHEYLKTHTQKFKAMELDGGGEDEDDEEEQAAASSKASNISGKRKAGMTSSFAVASESKRQTKSIADEIRKTPEEVVAERHRSKNVQRTMKDYSNKSKEQKDVVDGHVADFLYENCLPLNIINSRSWEILLESIGQYGTGYITPSYHDVRIPLLEKAKVKNDILKEKHEKAWKEYGCSLMSDGWMVGQT
jgi:RNase H-fold protein (predicted Holliday junction resolvase)